jgi:site-specific DNA-methyltransferase (adenine-specific)
MAVDKVLFASSETEWETPPELFRKLDKNHNFTLDPCATAENAKCKKFYTIEDDGLAQDWENEICFVNPPYGEPVYPCKKDAKGEFKCTKKMCEKRGWHSELYVPGVIDWVKKGYVQALAGATVVMLLPARTDTKWWHRYVMKSHAVGFIEGRVKFLKPGGAKFSAPFPSCIALFYPEPRTINYPVLFKL